MLPGSRVFGVSDTLSGPSSAILRAAAASKPASTAAALAAAASPPPAAAEAEDDDGAIYVCPYSKKQFKSRAAFENFKQSKKYKMLAATAAKESPMQPPFNAHPGISTSTGSPATSSSAAMADHAPPPPSTTTPPNAGASSSISSDDDDDDHGWVDIDEPWEPRWNESIFDGFTSPTFEGNALHMRRVHGFVVPTVGLLDARGLFAYLQEKVYRRHACVCCHRRFGSVEAARDHMHAKRHCRLNLDDDRALAEVAAFYNLDAAWIVRHVGRMDANGELVLPTGR